MSTRVVLSVLLSDARRRPAATAASLIAVSVGVAVFVAIHLAVAASRASFVQAVEAVAGRTTHEVTRPGGVAEERFAVFASIPGLEGAHPVVAGRAGVVAIERPGDLPRSVSTSIEVVGLDPSTVAPFRGSSEDPLVKRDDRVAFLTEPAVVVSEPFASRHEVAPGDRLRIAAAGRERTLEVLAVSALGPFREAARDTAICDLATAQEVFDRIGRLDRIELIAGDAALERVRAALAPGERLERPERRGRRTAQLTDAFGLNLRALAALALLVGGLLVFTSSEFTVVRRAPLLGRLRCLGVTRSALLTATLAETALVGIAGASIGVVGGAALARYLVDPVARTVTDLYGFVRVAVPALDARLALGTVGAATAVSLLAALLAAMDAARTAPRLVGSRSREQRRFRCAVPVLAAAGVAAAVLGISLARAPSGRFWPGLLAAAAFLAAGAALLPVAMAGLLPLLRRGSERAGAVLPALASGALAGSLRRAGGAAAALAVALAMTVSVTVMIHSFELEVRRWIDSVLDADLYVSEAAAGRDGRFASRLPAELVEAVPRLPGVRSVETRRAIELVARNGGEERTVRVEGVGGTGAADLLARCDLLASTPDPAHRLQHGAVLVSEPLARHLGLRAGERLRIDGPGGETNLEVAAVFRDYARDSGVVLALVHEHATLLADAGIHGLGVRVAPDADPKGVAGAIRGLAGTAPVAVRSHRELRASVLAVFDRTFAVTGALRAIATAMALVGITVTLVALFLERGREIATLRALGASGRTVRGLFALEALLLAAFPILFAVPLGGVLAVVLVEVIHLRSFGWSIRLAWPLGSVAGMLALAAGAALAATLVPAARARRPALASALREE